MPTRTFATKFGAVTAIRANGFQNLAHRIDQTQDGKFKPVFVLPDAEDREYVQMFNYAVEKPEGGK